MGLVASMTSYKIVNGDKELTLSYTTFEAPRATCQCWDITTHTIWQRKHLQYGCACGSSAKDSPRNTNPMIKPPAVVETSALSTRSSIPMLDEMATQTKSSSSC